MTVGGANRRSFLAGAAAAATLIGSAYAQQPGQRRIGILIGAAPTDPVGQGFLDAIRAGLAENGWIEGANLAIEARFNPGDPQLARDYAAELVSLQPDAIICGATPNAVAVHDRTTTIPIVFVAVFDPVGSGLVESFARPGGNVTGFTNFEPTVGGRWLGLLRQIVPSIRAAMYMHNPELPSGRGFLPSFLAAAVALDVEPIVRTVVDPVQIAAGIDDLAGLPDAAFVLGYDNFMFSHRAEVLDAIGRNHLPAIYGYQDFADEGGLVAYAIDTRSNFRRAGVLAARILAGADPAALPVEAPDRFLLVLNLRAATELGIRVPADVMAAADRFVE